jgi:hypothetical protein
MLTFLVVVLLLCLIFGWRVVLAGLGFLGCILLVGGLLLIA